MENLPILYSFRRCPYAIRARMALSYCRVEFEHREVLLKNKPRAMLDASPKGTVPVLVLPDGSVIDESLDVMKWALARSDTEQWQTAPLMQTEEAWLETNDGPFKYWLDRYKYADRFPERPVTWYREQAVKQLQPLDTLLAREPWVHGRHMGFCDVALFPFIRQFAMVDRDWFQSCELDATRTWLAHLLNLPLFEAVMTKRPLWQSPDIDE